MIVIAITIHNLFKCLSLISVKLVINFYIYINTVFKLPILFCFNARLHTRYEIKEKEKEKEMMLNFSQKLPHEE